MPQNSLQPHLAYRPDIDGMRALAVLAVIIFHLYPKFLKTGYIGVDVFFVISGYLISSIIIQEKHNQIFSLKRFYQRRVMRIFPVLLTVLACSYAGAWLIMSDLEFVKFSKHLSGGVFFAANWISWGEAGYFDTASESKPLLHLWSLGIEEQFYLLWPIVLLSVLRFRRWPWIWLSSLALVSFVLCVWVSLRDQSTAFYLPFSRAWELIAGALLATLSQHSMTLRAWAAGGRTYYSDLLSLAGLLSLVLSLVLIDHAGNFPGYSAALPVLAACLLIIAGPAALINRYLLSQKVLVKIGLISFSWYLWHWPLLSFTHIIESAEPSSRQRNLILIASLLLAILSYHLLERPLRRARTSRSLVAVLMAWIGMGLLGLLSLNLPSIYQRQVVSLNPINASSGLDGGAHQLSQPCDLPDYQRQWFLVCAKDQRGKVKYALIGDSKAHAMYKGLVRTSDNDGRWMFVGGTQQQGATIPVISDAPEFAPYQQSSRLALNLIERDQDIQVAVFVVSMRALFQLSDTQMTGNRKSYNHDYLQQLAGSKTADTAYQGLKLAIQGMHKSGKKVVFVVDNPPLPEASECAGRRTGSSLLNHWMNLEQRGARAECFLSLDKYKQDSQIYRQFIQKLQVDFPRNFFVYDPTSIYCDVANNVCGPAKNNRLMYSYTDHISDYAAGLVGIELKQMLSKI